MKAVRERQDISQLKSLTSQRLQHMPARREQTLCRARRHYQLLSTYCTSACVSISSSNRWMCRQHINNNCWGIFPYCQITARLDHFFSKFSDLLDKKLTTASLSYGYISGSFPCVIKLFEVTPYTFRSPLEKPGTFEFAFRRNKG